MDPIRFAALRRLGLKHVTLRQLLSERGDTIPWRVCRVDRGQCTVLGLGEDGAVTSRRVRPPTDPVAVGDWVALHPRDPDRIAAIADRSTVLRRGAVGADGQSQLIASNLDVVFVVSGFGVTEKLERRGLNARRIERYVAAIRDGGALPVAVINKADLTGHTPATLGELRRDLSARLGVDVLCVSAATGFGLDTLRHYLAAGETVAFVGPSGVGKSTLINLLLDRPALDVGSVRDSDAKGRHTTSHRELLAMPGGALLVDTPGMREFAVFSESGDAAGFSDIEELAGACRFADCAHDAEPGCAVLEAVARGDLLADRLANYQGLRRDAQRMHAKQDSLARHVSHKKARAFGRMVREATEIKGR